MGDVVKAVVTIAAVAFAVVTGGLSTVAFFGLTGTAATIATIAVYSSAMLALGAISQALAPKPRLSQRDNRVPIRSTVASRKLAFGQFASGGVLVYASSHGSKNEELYLVYAHSVGEIEGFTGLKVADDFVTFDGNGDAIGDHNGYLKAWFFTGTDAQAACAALVGYDNWTAAHQLKGVAYHVVMLKYSTKHWPNGVPPMHARGKGLKVYDPRLDSTVAGGSGAHRENDPSTWAYSENPALWWLYYKRNVTYGCGVPVARIDIASVQAAANVCDETITHADLSTSARWWGGGVIDTASRKSDNEDMILSAMGGIRVYTGGVYELYAASWDTPTVELTADDLRGPVKVTTRVARRERVNLVRGQYIDSDEFLPSDFPEVGEASWITADGGEELPLDLDLPMTLDHRIAQRAGLIQGRRARKETTVVWPSKIIGLQLKAWSTVMVTLDRFGWNQKTFRVVEWSFNPGDGGVDLVLREEDASVYTFANEGTRPPRTIPWWRRPGDTIEVGGFALFGTARTGTAGESEPAISVSWTPESDPFVDWVQLQFKESTDTEWIPHDGADANGGAVLITGLNSGTTYDVRMRYVNVSGVASNAWASAQVTTGSTHQAGDTAYVDAIPATAMSGVIDASSRIRSTAYVDQGDGVSRFLPRGTARGTARDGDAITFTDPWPGTDIPIVQFGAGGVSQSDTLTGKQSQAFEALNMSASGFTADLRIRELVGATTLHTDGPDNTSPWEIDKSVAAEAYDDKYTFSFTCLIENDIGDGNPFDWYPGFCTVGIYTNDGGGWVFRASVQVSGSFNTSSVSRSQSTTVTVDGLGQHAGTEFRILRLDGNQAGSDITSFDSVKYYTAAAAPDETATPSGAPDVPFQVIGGAESGIA